MHAYVSKNNPDYWVKQISDIEIGPVVIHSLEIGKAVKELVNHHGSDRKVVISVVNKLYDEMLKSSNPDGIHGTALKALAAKMQERNITMFEKLKERGRNIEGITKGDLSALKNVALSIIGDTSSLEKNFRNTILTVDETADFMKAVMGSYANCADEKDAGSLGNLAENSVARGKNVVSAFFSGLLNTHKELESRVGTKTERNLISRIERNR